MPVNVQLNDANFSLGPESGFFYSCSYNLQSLLKVEADGTVVDTYPVSLSTFRNPIKELHFDGTFFWTLENLPSNLGLSLKRWRLYPFKTKYFPSVTPSELRWQDEVNLINLPAITWSADAFAVEHYHKTFNGSFASGVNTIRLNNVANINIGDTLYLGPSTYGGSVGTEEKIVVTSINSTTSDISFSKSGGLENGYSSGNQIDFYKSVFIFNQHSYSGRPDNRGTIVQLNYPSNAILVSDVGGRYANVTAADFDNSILSWVRSFQILELDMGTTSWDLSASQEANLVEDNRHTLIVVYDLISDLNNNQYLKLQTKETTENLGTGVLTTQDFSGKYNFQVQPIPAFVNSISLSFDTRFSEPHPPSADTISIVAEVRDQFNFPMFNKTVQFSSAINGDSDPGIPGTFNPSSAITSVSGTVETIYTPSSTPDSIIVDITAEVL